MFLHSCQEKYTMQHALFPYIECAFCTSSCLFRAAWQGLLRTNLSTGVVDFLLGMNTRQKSRKVLPMTTARLLCQSYPTRVEINLSPR
jgi:hypothetical protein